MTPRLDRIGKFELIDSLGEGSLGQVFLARDTIIGREVAIKVVRRASLAPPDPQGRFLRETQAAGRLNHPNLVTIHEFGEKAGVLFQVMDHVPGDELGAGLPTGAIPARDALELLAQVCDGLAYIHQHGLLHRNLKPSNIRMGRAAGRPAPKLMDFAITRVPVDEPAAAAAHLATLAHAAPETFGAGKVDGRADLFSVGVLLYQALTGRAPFAGDAPADIAQRIIHEEPPVLDPLQFPELSPALPDILRRALAKDPAKRFPSAEALAEALRAARNPAWTPDLEPPVVEAPAKPFLHPARPDRPFQPRTRSLRPWFTALSALVVLALLGGAGGLWLRARHRKPRPALPVAAAPAPPMVVASPLQPVQPPPPAAPPAAAPAPAAPPQPSAAPLAQPPAAVKPTPTPTPTAAARAYTTLDQAAAGLEQDPKGALGYLDPAFAADPANERAAALRIVAFYRVAQYSACSKAIKEARDAGHPLWPMALRNPPLRAMLEEDAKALHLPRHKPTPPAAAPPAE